MREEADVLRLSEELAEEDPREFTRRFIASLVLLFSRGRKRGFRRLLSLADVALTLYDNREEIMAVSDAKECVMDLGDFRSRRGRA
jgi:hypothetical protein